MESPDTRRKEEGGHRQPAPAKQDEEAAARQRQAAGPTPAGGSQRPAAAAGQRVDSKERVHIRTPGTQTSAWAGVKGRPADRRADQVGQPAVFRTGRTMLWHCCTSA